MKEYIRPSNTREKKRYAQQDPPELNLAATGKHFDSTDDILPAEGKDRLCIRARDDDVYEPERRAGLCGASHLLEDEQDSGPLAFAFALR